MSDTIQEHLDELDSQVQANRKLVSELRSVGWDEIETLYPIKCPKALGERVSTDTLRRWSKQGLYSHRTGRTVVLETVNRGRMIYTSKERILAFYRRHSGIRE